MYNKIILIGRTTADPELRFSQGGKPYAKFTLAVGNPFKNAQGEKTTEFIDHVVFSGQAEAVSNNVKKGYLLATDGRLTIRSYDDKDGNRRKAVEVVAENVRFLDRGKDGNGGQRQSTQGQDKFSEVSYDDSDLPF